MPLNMHNEDFLHYLWKYSFYTKPLILTDGTPVEVLSAGEQNNDAGPDFFNSKIKIGNTVWAGNVEIHVKSSDWFKHNHHNDSAYDNIILHVVAQNDKEIARKSGEKIPVVELKSPEKIYNQYLFLMQSNGWIPCETFINKVDSFTVFQWKEVLMIERLQEKSTVVEQRFISNNKNREETFYQSLAANFGFKTNALPFEMLAKSLPLKYLAKHKDSLSFLEAMLFGQAGLLPELPKDEYTKELVLNYKHLKNKFKLSPLNGNLWKFSKMRPPNFPVIRISQFANLIYKSEALMSKIVEANSFNVLRDLFDIETSNYWQTHYTFEKESPRRIKKLGDSAFQNIVINTIAPFFAFYGKVKNQNILIDKAIGWLTELKPESNRITRHWEELGLKPENAFDSQSLIQLKNKYCNKRRCLNCRIGNQVIRYKV
jgi:hypothetical protein